MQRQIANRFCHKVTGEDIEGVLRAVVTTEDGLIARWVEYTDVESLKAFMGLVAFTESDRSCRPAFGAIADLLRGALEERALLDPTRAPRS